MFAPLQAIVAPLASFVLIAQIAPLTPAPGGVAPPSAGSVATASPGSVATAAPGGVATASAGSVATASPGSAALPSGGRVTFPSGRRSAAGLWVAFPSASANDALVRNSGSTNAPGYVFVVHPDATVDAVFNGAVERKTIGHAQAAWLFNRLKADAPLGDVGGGCMRSASFGSTTTIAYAGQTTADLGCGGPAAQELTRTIGIIRGQIGLASRGPGLRPL